MSEVLGMAVVGAAGLYLVVLGLGALVAPTRAADFLLGFASTKVLHFFEIACRVIVGAALLVAAPRLSPSSVFAFAGWLLLGTSVVLAILPWRWHQRFAGRAVPAANRHIGLIGLSSLIAGGFVLVAVIRGSLSQGVG